MNKLTVKLNGYASKDTLFMVDGQKVKFKNNKFGNRIFEYQTEKNIAHITINRYLEINSKCWLLWQLLFFVISIFGIFDMRGARGYFVVDCELNVNLTEDTVLTLKMNDNPQKEYACMVESNGEVEEITNKYYIDDQAQRRGKALVWAKILTALALIGIGIGILFLIIGG